MKTIKRDEFLQVNFSSQCLSSPPRMKSLPANCLGNLMNCWGGGGGEVTCVGLCIPFKGGSNIPSRLVLLKPIMTGMQFL